MNLNGMSDGFSPDGGRHHFFEARSFRTALSSIASARSFFSRAFSSSSAFKRLAAGRAITGFAVAHHGGRAPGTPPTKPGSGTPRAAFSYGPANSYGHPLPNSLTRLIASRWRIGHPAAGIDERRTEDRSHRTGLGHIRLDWAGGASSPHGCTCGCTLDPTQ